MKSLVVFGVPMLSILLIGVVWIWAKGQNQSRRRSEQKRSASYDDFKPSTYRRAPAPRYQSHQPRRGTGSSTRSTHPHVDAPYSTSSANGWDPYNSGDGFDHSDSGSDHSGGSSNYSSGGSDHSGGGSSSYSSGSSDYSGGSSGYSSGSSSSGSSWSDSGSSSSSSDGGGGF